MNAPKLRFDEFSGEWVNKPIGKILTIGSGKDYKHLESGEIPVFGTGGLMTTVNSYLHDGETVCIGRKGTIDKPMYFNGKFWTVDTLFYTHTFKDVLPKFIYNSFLCINWKEHNQASGVPSLSKSIIEKIHLNLPTLPEQIKIANFHNAIDEKTNLLNRKVELITQYKKSVMQKIFSQELRFKDDEGREFGAWEEKSLGEVTSLFSKRNKNLIDAPVYSVTNSHGFVLQSEQFEGPVAGSDLTNYKIISENEFAYNPARINVGSIALFRKKVGVISSLYVCFRCQSSLDNNFLLHFLELESTKQHINSFGEGGVRIYLWYPLFSQIPISLPSKPEQTKIANFLTALDDQISYAVAELDAVKQYKQGLLQQMFV